MEALVSVVIPIYNRAHVISTTLDSLVMQSYKNFEVVIVDDCSDDSEALQHVLHTYDLNIVYVRHETNMHGGAARNTGINASNGNYIAFLDSDDVWAKDKLKLCLQHNVVDNEILYSQISDRKKIYPNYSFDNVGHVDEYLLVERQAMQTSSLFMKKKVAKQVLFDATLKRFQDTDFIIRSQKLHQIKFRQIETVLVYMTDADKGARISSSMDPYPALFWVHKVQDLLTEKSISVFMFNRVLNYASNSMPRYKLVKLFFKYKCYKFVPFLDYKVFLKVILGPLQNQFRR